MSDYHHSLAIKYFRGEISAEEENCLYGWVKEDEKNLITLNAWENEWVENAEVSEKWNRLIGHIAARGALEDAEIRVNRKSSRNWIWAVAAALVLLLAVTPFLFKKQQAPSQLYTLEAPAGEKCRVLLPDSSVVWLNSGSRLCFDDSFNRKERNVTLVGEGFFDVAHDETRPFRVNCGEVKVLVHGTEFNVSAYPEERYVTASVVEGHVSFIHKQARIELHKGQAARYDLVSEAFSRSSDSPVDASAWTESRFIYDNISLGELAEKLSRTYAVKFHFNTTEHMNDKFSISLRNNETLDDVLGALQKIIPISARVEGDNVYIDKKK